MKNLFFFDIDTQKDFMLKTGALYVPGAERIIPRLRRLFDFAVKNEISVISTMDTHTAGDPEFSEFPPHCVRGTDGWRKLDDTLLAHPLIFPIKPVDRNLSDCLRKNRQIIVEKDTFDAFSNPAMERLARALPPRAIVFGVATEYCVKKAVLGLRQLGVQTVVVSDAVRAIAPKTEKEAIDEMQAAGASFVPVANIFDL
ncbi:MAG: cysteine hydrolase [Acidobacteriota bacterium]|jgi:nicotinamidase/pyrazinamidase|nr:cysteine hydrolase [Acidobacteriota bacterium]